MMTNTQTLTRTRKKKGGFTLIEVIAVLVLLGILAAIALPRYIDMAENARERAIDAGISELNGREALAWGQIMLQDGGYDPATSDAAVQGLVGADLGTDYVLVVTDAVSGTIQFQGTPDPALAITRVASTATSPGNWSR